MKKYLFNPAGVCFITCFLLFTGWAQKRSGPLETADLRFSLIPDSGNYKLKIGKQDKIRYLSLPPGWLIPQEEEEYGYVSSFNYDKTVTTFRIGGEFTGLHISSYEIQKDGSAQAAAGRDVFLVYDVQEKRLFPGIIDLGITKDRIRSAGIFYATNCHFVLGDINRDGFRDIGMIKEKLEFSPRSQSLVMHPVEWYVFEDTGWIHQPNSSGKFPMQELIELPLIGLGKSPVDYVKERYLQRNVCVLNYEDFGVQAMAYPLIGHQWYQWDAHGDPDPNTKYDIKVVVYKDITLEKVREFFPVFKELKQDYRYVEFSRALHYLDKHIQEIEKLQQADTTGENRDMFEDLKSRLSKSQKIIAKWSYN